MYSRVACDTLKIIRSSCRMLGPHVYDRAHCRRGLGLLRHPAGDSFSIEIICVDIWQERHQNSGFKLQTLHGPCNGQLARQNEYVSGAEPKLGN